MLLKKDDVNARKSNFASRGVDFRYTSVLSRGRPMSRFTHLRSLQGLLCDAKTPRSDAGSTPINHSAKCLYFFIVTNRPLTVFLEGISSYFQCGEVMHDNTSS